MAKGITIYTIPAKTTMVAPTPVMERRENGITVTESFPGHKGRPGQRGGSQKKSGGLGGKWKYAKSISPDRDFYTVTTGARIERGKVVMGTRKVRQKVWDPFKGKHYYAYGDRRKYVK